MGTNGVDLFSFLDPANQLYPGSLYRAHTLICRTNFQNAFAVNDTLGLIRFTGFFQTSPFTPVISDFKAVLADGTEIPFNICTGSIFIDSSSVFVNEIEKIDFNISPNPANELLNISFSNASPKNIVLRNSPGEKVKELKLSEEVSKISVVDLPNGFYFGTVLSEKQ